MKQGVAADLVKAGVQAVARDRQQAAGEQADMFALDLPSEGLTINGRRWSVDDLTAEANRRRPGRPKGSEGQTTKEFRDYLLRRGVDPAESMMRDLSLPLEAFAALLGCSKLEAWDRRQRLRESLRKMFYPDLAATDDAGNAVIPSFFIQVGGQTLDASGRELPPWEVHLKTVENQPLEDEPTGESHNGESQK